MKQVSLLDKKIYPFLNRSELLSYISDKKNILIAINAEKILKDNEKLTEIINNNIGYADGIGAVWALKKKGFSVEKIPGVELWLDIVKKYSGSKSFYLIGSNDIVINETVKKLKIDYPDINIVNYRNGFLKDGEKELLITDILEKKPDIIFAAMGTPKQEFLMNDIYTAYPALYMGLGGSFDVYCGLLKRAPKLFLKLKIEWLYRLLKEPTRIVRQIHLIKFVLLLKFNKL
jgi:UDP-N-acetyl-D-mannosaminouronate:lipid I N-acetyl-D-mannosaminouronosyltransferase